MSNRRGPNIAPARLDAAFGVIGWRLDTDAKGEFSKVYLQVTTPQ